MTHGQADIKQISDNEIYLLIKYIKSVLWRVAKCLSYIEDARCLKVNDPAASFSASFNYTCHMPIQCRSNNTHNECVWCTGGVTPTVEN